MRSISRVDRGRVYLVLLVLALTLILRLYRLGEENFWIDEVNQVQVASQSLKDIVRNYHPEAQRVQRGRWLLQTWDQAPLSLLITHFFLSEEAAEFHARVPSLIFSCVGVLALFAFARIFVPFHTALLAMFLLAISPLDVWYSQDARWYAQWSLFATLSYWALVQVGRERTYLYWAGYAIVTGANLYTFVNTAFVVFAQAVSLIWRRWRGWATSRTVVVFVVVLVLVLISTAPVLRMVIGSLEDANSGTPRSSSLLELPYSLLTYSVGFTVGPSLSELHSFPGLGQVLTEHFEIVLVLAVFLPLTLIGLSEVRKREDLASWLLPWALVPASSVFLVALIIPEMTYQIRYTFASLPAFCLVLAVGLMSIERRIRWFALASVVALSLFSLSNFYWQDRYDKSDLRGAVAYVRAEEPGPAQMAVVGQVVLAMPYYGDYPDLDVVLKCGTEAGEFDLIDRSRRLWLVAGRDWNLLGQRCRNQLADSYVSSGPILFPGVEVWKLEPTSPGEASDE